VSRRGALAWELVGWVLVALTLVGRWLAHLAGPVFAEPLRDPGRRRLLELGEAALRGDLVAPASGEGALRQTWAAVAVWSGADASQQSLLFSWGCIALAAALARSLPLARTREERSAIFPALAALALTEEAIAPGWLLTAGSLGALSSERPDRRRAVLGSLLAGLAVSWTPSAWLGVAGGCAAIFFTRPGRRDAAAALTAGAATAVVGGWWLLGLALRWDHDWIALPPLESGRVAGIATWIGLVAAAGLALHRRGLLHPSERTWLAVAVAVGATALLDARATHQLAAVSVAAAALAVTAARTFSRHRGVSALLASALLLLMFGWPVALPRLTARAPLEAGAGLPPYTDEARAAAWASRHIPEDTCVVAPSGEPSLRAALKRPGPLDPFRDRDGGARLARRLEEADCPWALQRWRASSTEGWGALHFGPDLLLRAERYEPVARLGPDLWITRRRIADAPPTAHRVPIRTAPDELVDVPGEVRVQLDRPVLGDSVLAVELDLEPVGWDALRPLAPRVFVEMRSHARVVTPRFEVAVPRWGGAMTLLVPVHPVRAEQRWITGMPAGRYHDAERFVLQLAPSEGGPTRARVRVKRITELRPGGAVSPPPPFECTPSTPITLSDALLHHVDGERDGARLWLTPHPPGGPAAPNRGAYFTLRPCRGACLVAEIGAEGEGRGRVRAEVWDAAQRTDIVDRPLRGGEWRQPIEIPLDPWALRFVMLGLHFEVEEGPLRPFLHRPRIEPCSAPVSLIHAFQDGDHEVVRGAARVSGDELALTSLPPEQTPAQVKLSFRVPADASCLAISLDTRHAGRAMGALVGVERGGVMWRLRREILEPGEGPRDLRDLSLERWVGQEVALVMSAWPIQWAEGPPEGDALFLRPRLHRCGEAADWTFAEPR